MNPLAALLDLRLWVPKGSQVRQKKIIAEPVPAANKLQRPVLTPVIVPPVVAPVAAPIKSTPHPNPPVAVISQRRLRLAMTSLTPTVLLIVESGTNDGDAEHQLLHSLLQAIERQQSQTLPPLKYFQWPPASKSTLAMGQLEDALSGLLHHAREQGTTQMVILNHQLHQLLMRESVPELHAPITHTDGFTLFFSYSLQAMQQNPQLKKEFWLFLKSRL